MTGIKAVQKFIVTIAGKDVEFNSEAEAIKALAKVNLATKAQAYVDSLRDKDGKELGDKDKKGKFNVILDFLASEEAAKSAAPAEEAPAAEPTVEEESF